MAFLILVMSLLAVALALIFFEGLTKKDIKDGWKQGKDKGFKKCLQLAIDCLRKKLD